MIIQKNLEKAQINQSQYLAFSSMQSLEEGDRMLAMQLAMEALPSRSSDRPYVAQAEYALGKALGIYTSTSRPQAVGAINCNAVISEFKISDDRKVMYVVDKRNILSVWNMETYEQIADEQLTDSVKDLIITENGNILVLSYANQVLCYNQNAELLWQTADVSSAAMSQDRDILLLLCEKRLIFLNPDTGTEEMSEVEIQLPKKDDTPRLSLLQEYYDIQQPVMVVYKDPTNETVLGVNIHSDQTVVMDTFPEGMVVRYTKSTENGELFVCAADESFLLTGSFGEMVTKNSIQNQLRCYQSMTFQHKWTAELTSFSFSSQYMLEAIGEDRLLWQTDTAICQVDITSGEVLKNCELSAAPLWSEAQDDSAMLLLSDGFVGTYNYDDNSFNSIKYFKENLQAGFWNESVYVNQTNSVQILVYSDLWDKNWEIVDSAKIGSISDYQIHGKLAAILHTGGISLIDTKEKSLLWTLTEDMFQKGNLLGFSDDGNFVWLCSKDCKIYQIDVSTGEYCVFELPAEINGIALSYTVSDGCPQKNCKQFYFTAFDKTNNDCCIVSWDSESTETSVYPLCTINNETGKSALLCVSDRVVYAWEESTKSIYRLNTKTLETNTIRENITSYPIVQFIDDKNTIALCEDNHVTIIYADGKELSVDLEDQKGISCHLMKDSLLVITDGAKLMRFHIKTGEKMGETSLEIYSSFFSNISYDYHPNLIRWTHIDEKTLIIDIFNAGNIIQTEQWNVVAFVPECVGYLPEESCFLTGLEGFSPDGQQLGIFSYYSTEEIQAMAEKALENYTLTYEQKYQYGLIK